MALLHGRVAVVTGADRGIGRGIAIALARAGCWVAINHVDRSDRADAVVSEICTSGGAAMAVRADVRVGSDVARMMKTVVEHSGRIDILVNNAGVQTWKPFLDITEDEWDLVIDTNLKGCFLCTQAAARHMTDRGGAVINIGSGSNKVPFPSLAAYTASKGGIEMLTKVAAVELASRKIRVNCVAPGAVLIERTRAELKDYSGTMAKNTPLARVGTPEDIASAVLFLASAQASFITGQTLSVDGGLFVQPPRIFE
jgi:NAD(P)-dependent dehydrogenase (short-subunit alcohol dehydrogenase family)